jgi:hypothetical protein
MPIIDHALEVKLTTVKAAKVLKSRSISDHWKERILPKYAFRISKYSVISFIYLVIAVCPFLLAGLFSSLIKLNFFDLIFEIFPIVGISIFALGYMVLRNRYYLTSKYSLTSRLLHHLALNSDIRCELLFDLEKYIFSKVQGSSADGNHVFVCGLARSGTTILMRALHQSDKFSSLTYRDMPFILAPNIWSKIIRKSNISMQKEVRAHDDGILVDFDSPEALEEVFWRVFAGKEYIHSNFLKPHEIDSDIIAAFRDYVALINLKYLKSRYLSKNNNNILRLKGITDTFPNATVLVPFREPLQQAFSLLKQHQNFVIQHREDKFSEKYMSWLVHHEFGLDHRRFLFVDDMYQHSDINTIDYWLHQWINAYSYLLERINTSKKRIFLVGYEDICHKDRLMWQKIIDLVEIPKSNCFDFILSKAIIPTQANGDLKSKASEIYFELLTNSRKRIGLT